MSDTVSLLAADVSAWIDALESLDHERAPLVARYGPGGTFDHERKVLLASIKNEYRLGAATRISADSLDDMGHADERYTAMIDRAAADRVRLAELDATRVALEHRIQHARTMLYLNGRLAGLT